MGSRAANTRGNVARVNIQGRVLFEAHPARGAPQAPDKFNPKVRVQTCGIIQKLYETTQIKIMTFRKSVMALFSKIEPKTSKYDMKKWLKTGKMGRNLFWDVTYVR